MMKFLSEKAMALVDGQLAPSEAPAVVQALARSPEEMRNLQKYLAVGPGQMRPLYADIVQEPVPQSIMDTVLFAQAGKAQRREAGVVEKLVALAARTRESYRVPGWSLAAGPALAGVLVAVAVYTLMPTASIGAYADAGIVAPPLESTASDATAQVVVKPVLSYRSKADEFCRQFEVQYNAKQSSHAVACRKATGSWQMMVATKPGPIIPGDTPSGVQAREPADKFVDANIAGRHLELDEEKEVLATLRASPR